MKLFSDKIKRAFNLRRINTLAAHRRWVLTVGDKNRFQQLFEVQFSLRTLFIWGGALFLLMLFIAGAVIVATPLRSLLPGYLGRSERESLEVLTDRVDSMRIESYRRMAWAENISAILNDRPQEGELEVSLSSADTLGSIPVDSLLPAGDAERKFVDEFEKQKQYGRTIAAPAAGESLKFEMPLSPVIESSVSSENPDADMMLRGVGGQGVASPLHGTVIAAYYDPADLGATVIIRHPGEFISVMHGLSTVYATKGEELGRGQRIGTLGREGRMTFELWHRGIKVSPANYLPKR